MKVRRINENTISCTITPEDLREHGFHLDDFFERKKEAVEFVRASVAEAARSENFKLEGELTTLRISVMPDHSLNLLITREDTSDGAMSEVRRIARSIFESIAAKKAMEAGGAGKAANDGSDGFDGSAGETEGEEARESLMKALLTDAASENTDADGAEQTAPADAYMFSFFSVRDAMDCTRLFADAGPIESSLYYLREDDAYYLIVRRTDRTPPDFARRVLSANEFGDLVTSNEQYIAFVTEHGTLVAGGSAVEMFLEADPVQEKKPGKKAEKP